MTNTTTPNRYPATCEGCGNPVPAREGVLVGRMVGGSGRWLVRHIGCGLHPSRPTVDHGCMVHGPADDECLGARCLTPGNVARRTRTAVCGRHGNTWDAAYAHRGGCWECAMEADIAERDRME